MSYLLPKDCITVSLPGLRVGLPTISPFFCDYKIDIDGAGAADAILLYIFFGEKSPKEAEDVRGRLSASSIKIDGVDYTEPSLSMFELLSRIYKFGVLVPVFGYSTHIFISSKSIAVSD